MEPSRFPDHIKGEAVWFADPRNHDFTCYTLANREQQDRFKDLIADAVGFDNAKEVEDLCREQLDKTSLGKTGSGTTSKSELAILMQSVFGIIQEKFDDLERPAFFDSWLKKALMAYLLNEIRRAKNRDNHDKAYKQHGGGPGNSGEVGSFPSSLSSSTATSETAQNSYHGDNNQHRNHHMSPLVENPAISRKAPREFPALLAEQIGWFAEPRNHDFSSYVRCTKPMYRELQALVVDVIGLEDVDHLKNILQTELYKTDLWKAGTGVAKMSHKVDLVNTIIIKIEDRFQTGRPVGYSRWLNGALLCCIQHEVTSAKKRQASKKFRNDHAGTEPNSFMPKLAISFPHAQSQTHIQNEFPKSLGDQAKWFANAKNHDFSAYRPPKDRADFWEPLQMLIVEVTGLKDLNAVRRIIYGHFNMTELSKTGGQMATKLELDVLANVICAEIETSCNVPQAIGFSRWLRTAIKVYLPREIRLAKRSGRVNVDSEALWKKPSVHTITSNKFPDDSVEQALWFADPENRDFSNYSQRSREFTNQLRDLIVKVTGFNSSEELAELCSHQIYSTEHWKIEHVVTRAEKFELVDTVYDFIEEFHKEFSGEKRPAGYQNWVKEALMLLFRLELESIREKSKKRRKIYSTPEFKRVRTEINAQHAVYSTLVRQQNTQNLTSSSDSNRAASTLKQPATEDITSSFETNGTSSSSGSSMVQDQLTKMLQQRDAENTELMGIVEMQNQQLRTQKDDLKTLNGELEQLRHARSSTPADIQISSQRIQHSHGIQIPPIMFRLAPLKGVELGLKGSRHEEFSFEFLRLHLGGYPMYNGRYTIPNFPETRLFPALRHYRLLDMGREPLLPTFPSQHGVQISFMPPDIADPAHGREFAVFIRRDEGDYKYFGHYEEPRSADRLGGSDMTRLPGALKKHWAKVLSSQPLIEKLRKSMSSEGSEIDLLDCTHHQGQHYELRMRMDDMTWMYNIMAAFERPDSSPEAPLRLFYEYLECVRYDLSFYLELVKLKFKIRPGVRKSRVLDECDYDGVSAAEMDVGEL